MNSSMDSSSTGPGRAVVLVGVFVSLLMVSSSAAFAAAPKVRVIAESPLAIMEGPRDGVATRLALDPAGYKTIKSGEQVLLKNFVLGSGMRADLELRRIHVFAEDAVIVTGTPQGDVPLPRPDVVLLGGQVVGSPESSVFLSLSPHGNNGLVRLAQETFILSTGLRADGKDTVIYNLTTLPQGTVRWLDFHCGADALPVLPWSRLAASPVHAGASTRDAPCRIADLAIETDWEFTGSLFGGDTDASGAYAATLIGAVSEIYTRDLNVRLRISYLRLWSSSSDPWDQGNTIDQLYQYQDYWNANMTHVQRTLAHYLSGRGLGGGVAYGGVICYPDYDYGLSASLGGYFPYPVQHNHAQNWDPFVVSHELGHNFGAPHTHDMNPPIDQCASGDCSVTPNGTIMSYCHGCPGGMTNIRLEFHTRMINEVILPYLSNDAGCDLSAQAATITEHPIGTSACDGGAVTLTVVAGGTAPFDYQWRRNGTDIPGATGDSYTVDPVGPGDAGNYDVIVSNACGWQASNAATVTVALPVPADLDIDCDVDLDDFATFARCFNGAGVTTPPAACATGEFEAADLDGDGDADLNDFSTFASAFTN